eukprot:4639806-Prymnesium_polylepis.1
MHMGAAIKNPMTPELKAELQKLAVANGGPAAPRPFFAAPTAAAAAASSILDIVKSNAPSVFKTVNMSVSADFWNQGSCSTSRTLRRVLRG